MKNSYSFFDERFYSYLETINSGNYFSRFTDKEKIREWKKRFIKQAEKSFMAVRVNVSPLYETPKFWRANRYVVNVWPEFITKFSSKDDIKKIVHCLSLIPKQSHEVHWRMVVAYLYNNAWILKWCKYASSAILNLVKDYFEGRIIYEEVMKNFMSLDGWGEANVWGSSSGKYKGWVKVWKYQPVDDLDLYKEALKKMTKNFVKQARAEFTPSIREGKRINRGYIEWTSYKPLLSKTINTWKKSKVVVIHDCSGSMGDANMGTNEPAYKAVSFIGALVNSWVVDVQHVVYHSEYGFEDVVDTIKKWDIHHLQWCAEGFQFLDDNLPSEWVKDCDFVVVTTDLEYSKEAEEGLYEYVSRAPAHLILSFKNTWTLNGLNVRKVSTIKDMMGAVVSLAR